MNIIHEPIYAPKGKSKYKSFRTKVFVLDDDGSRYYLFEYKHCPKDVCSPWSLSYSKNFREISDKYKLDSVEIQKIMDKLALVGDFYLKNYIIEL